MPQLESHLQVLPAFIVASSKQKNKRLHMVTQPSKPSTYHNPKPSSQVARQGLPSSTPDFRPNKHSKTMARDNGFCRGYHRHSDATEPTVSVTDTDLV